MERHLTLQLRIATSYSLVEILFCLIEISLGNTIARILTEELLTRDKAQDGTKHYDIFYMSLHFHYMLKFRPILNVRDRGYEQ